MRAKNAAYARKRRTEKRLQTTLGNADTDLTGSCSSLCFQPKFESFVMSQMDNIRSAPENTCEESEIKSEYNQGSCSSFDTTSQASFVPQDILQNKTPEEMAERLTKTKSAKKETKIRQRKRSRATENEKRLQRRQMETPEQTAERRAKAAEAERNRRLQLRLSLTPDELAALRAKHNANEKNRREKKRLQFLAQQILAPTPKKAARKETPEQIAARRAKKNEKEVKRRQQLRLSLTPEKLAEMRAKNSAYVIRRRKLKRLQIAAEKMSDKMPIEVKFEKTDAELTEYCSWSSFESSEANVLIKMDSISPAETSACKSVAVKSELSQGSWSSFDTSQTSFVSKDTPQEFESFKTWQNFDNKPTVIIPPVLQPIIVKEELDL